MAIQGGEEKAGKLFIARGFHEVCLTRRSHCLNADNDVLKGGIRMLKVMMMFTRLANDILTRKILANVRDTLARAQ